MTGFAIANRFLAQDFADVGVGGTLLGLPYEEARRFITVEVLDLYLSDPGASWRLLGGRDSGGTVTMGRQEVGRADLAGAFINKIHADHGDAAYAAFWQAMGTLGRAGTPEQARDNFLAAAQTATGEDYGFLFREAGAATASSAPTARSDDGVQAAPMDADCGCAAVEPWVLV